MTRLRFSANLGFLWNDIPLPAAIHAAKAAGFAAVECHWPYQTPAPQVKSALKATGLPMHGINTAKGGAADFGLSACPDRIPEARAAIEQAVDYAEAIDAAAVHVMAGLASGPKAEATFLDNLRYAASLTDRTLLIEPLNAYDAPGYFLQDTAQAETLLTALNLPQVKLMFDCYHVGRTESEAEVIPRLRRLAPLIGHIQIASVPDRLSPDQGTLNYAQVFAALADMGWSRPIGGEYRVEGKTEDSLNWMSNLTT